MMWSGILYKHTAREKKWNSLTEWRICNEPEALMYFLSKSRLKLKGIDKKKSCSKKVTRWVMNEPFYLKYKWTVKNTDNMDTRKKNYHSLRFFYFLGGFHAEKMEDLCDVRLNDVSFFFFTLNGWIGVWG